MEQRTVTLLISEGVLRRHWRPARYLIIAGHGVLNVHPVHNEHIPRVCAAPFAITAKPALPHFMRNAVQVERRLPRHMEKEPPAAGTDQIRDSARGAVVVYNPPYLAVDRHIVNRAAPVHR